ncbi:MAG: Rieske 2Fe-2S domain-containing protein [Myxococcales bacterium]|nr:Rieske 2Fe-2S domain-containing protein [Myxococcales bacterium]
MSESTNPKGQPRANEEPLLNESFHAHEQLHANEQLTAPDGRPAKEQPTWRRDFPVDSARDEYVSRRAFAQFIVLTSAAFAAGQAWIGAKSLFGRRVAAPPVMAIATIDELTIGGAKTFRYPEGSSPRLLIRLASREFVAYDQQCTHLQCPVIPAVAQGRLHCPCHNGWFDLKSGQPIAGPPRRRLPRIRLEIRGDTVFAVGVEGAPS